MATLNPVAGGPLPTRGLLSFGFRRTVTHTHQGVDIGAPIGTPVRAVSAGRVTQAHSKLGPGFSGYGRVIVIKGDQGKWFLYAHLDKVFVRVGQRIFRGQKIGTVGRTCFRRSGPEDLCKGPHLHFEVSPRSYPQPAEARRDDPVAWLQKAPPLAFPVVPTIALVGLGGLLVFLIRRRRRLSRRPS